MTTTLAVPVFPLASLALADDAAKEMDRLQKAVKSRQTQRLTLDSPLPVYFLYWTAFADPDGSVEFRPDIYDRDTPLIAALNKADPETPMREVPMSATPPAQQDSSEGGELSP